MEDDISRRQNRVSARGHRGRILVVTEADVPEPEDQLDDVERKLAGSSGDDVSAGTSVSGVGGELLRTDSVEAGLPPVAEGGARLGWGRDRAESGEEPPARNDGTGQSEKDPAAG